MSPTARTLQYFREQGCIAAVVEKWNPHAKIRQDLFGCIDLLVIQGRKLIAIQATSGTNHNARMTKCIGNDKLCAYLYTGNLFEIFSWSKKGPRGKAKHWVPRVTQLTVVNGEIKPV